MTDSKRPLLSDLAARLRRFVDEMASDGMSAPAVEDAIDALDELRKLCNERKWSVMVDESGRQEDAVLAVDVLRVLDSQRGENE